MGALEKIKEIEAEYAKTQKNKKTEGHLGLLRAKLAKLRTELLEPPGKKIGSEGEGFDVKRFGNARVCMIGFPSVGKSTLLSSITETDSLVAAYEFTTLTCIPGVINYKGCKIQLLDLPGIIEGASEGRGRGRQVIAIGKGSDLVLMVLDATKGQEQKAKITRELEKVGMRLNKKKPDIQISLNKVGGVRLISSLKLTKIDDLMVKRIFQEYKIHNADIMCREDVDIDDIIDAIEGNRKYVTCLYVYNKIDAISLEEVDYIARQENNVVISCQMKLNFEYLLDQIWKKLDLVRIYTKRQANPPDLEDPVVLSNERNGTTVRSVVEQIHKSLLNEFSHAMVWGRSVKFIPQKVGLAHNLADEDVIQIYKKSKQKNKDVKGPTLVTTQNIKQQAKNAHSQKSNQKPKEKK